jgi:hypothetical protein
MFQIRYEQLTAFREARNAGLRQRVLAALADRFPDRMRQLDPHQHDDLYHHAADRAEHYKFRNEKSLYVLAAAALVFGKGFDADERQAWCKDILADETLAEELAARLLELRIYMQTGVEL